MASLFDTPQDVVMRQQAETNAYGKSLMPQADSFLTSMYANEIARKGRVGYGIGKAIQGAGQYAAPELLGENPMVKARKMQQIRQEVNSQHKYGTGDWYDAVTQKLQDAGYGQEAMQAQQLGLEAAKTESTIASQRASAASSRASAKQSGFDLFKEQLTLNSYVTQKKAEAKSALISADVDEATAQTKVDKAFVDLDVSKLARDFDAETFTAKVDEAFANSTKAVSEADVQVATAPEQITKAGIETRIKGYEEDIKEVDSYVAKGTRESKIEQERLETQKLEADISKIKANADKLVAETTGNLIDPKSKIGKLSLDMTNAINAGDVASISNLAGVISTEDKTLGLDPDMALRYTKQMEDATSLLDLLNLGVTQENPDGMLRASTGAVSSVKNLLSGAIQQVKEAGFAEDSPILKTLETVDQEGATPAQAQAAYLEALAASYAKTFLVSKSRGAAEGSVTKGMIERARVILKIDSALAGDIDTTRVAFGLARREALLQAVRAEEGLNAPKRAITKSYLEQTLPADRKGKLPDETPIYAIGNNWYYSNLKPYKGE